MSELEILKHLKVIYDSLDVLTKAVLLLQEESIAKDEQKGIFDDMDQQIHEFFEELDCYRRKQ